MKANLCGNCRNWILYPELRDKIAEYKSGKCSKIENVIEVIAAGSVDNVHIVNITTQHNFVCGLYCEK